MNKSFISIIALAISAIGGGMIYQLTGSILFAIPLCIMWGALVGFIRLLFTI
jgi:branched-subunit amino acid ABC-type transport system permease component